MSFTQTIRGSWCLKDHMKVAPDLIVELKYTLREGGENGEVLEIMDEHWPLKFYFGGQNMLPAFERNLEGLAEGEGFSFLLHPEEAYGPLDPNKIREVSLQELPESERFPFKDYSVGDRLVFNMGTQEEQLGTVSEVLDGSVLVDFNHALAGKDLHFAGRILFIRRAREDELVAKRYIEPNGIRSDSRLDDEQ